MFEHGRSRLSCWYSAIGFLQIELGAALDAGRALVGSLVAGEEVWELGGEDLADGSVATGLHQRSDTTAVVPAAVIAQAEVALVLADALLEKTGGDSVAECSRNLWAYLDEVTQRTTFS